MIEPYSRTGKLKATKKRPYGPLLNTYLIQFTCTLSPAGAAGGAVVVVGGGLVETPFVIADISAPKSLPSAAANLPRLPLANANPAIDAGALPPAKVGVPISEVEDMVNVVRFQSRDVVEGKIFMPHTVKLGVVLYRIISLFCLKILLVTLFPIAPGYGSVGSSVLSKFNALA